MDEPQADQTAPAAPPGPEPAAPPEPEPDAAEREKAAAPDLESMLEMPTEFTRPVTIPDRIGNVYELQVYTEPGYDMILLIEEAESLHSSDARAQLDFVNKMMSAAMPPAEAEKLKNLLQQPGGPSVQSVIRFAYRMMGAVTGNPTGGLSASSPGDEPTTSTSDPVSSTPESTPPPLPPTVGSPPSTG